MCNSPLITMLPVYPKSPYTQKVFLCYMPTNFCAIIIFAIEDKISADVGNIVINLPVLNSMFNPLIIHMKKLLDSDWLRLSAVQR